MHYDPRQDARPLPYDPFKSCTVPRPIGWLSSISRDGKAISPLSASGRTLPTIRPS